jgi:hypothetical protein
MHLVETENRLSTGVTNEPQTTASDMINSIYNTETKNGARKVVGYVIRRTQNYLLP